MEEELESPPPPEPFPNSAGLTGLRISIPGALSHLGFVIETFKFLK